MKFTVLSNSLKRNTVYLRINAAAFIKEPEKSVRRLIEGGVYWRFIFFNLVNDSRYGNTDEDADEQEEINDSDEIECL